MLELKQFQKFSENSKEIFFSKIQGCGNNFVVFAVDRNTVCNLTKDLIRNICQKHFGVGSDGLMLILEPKDISVNYEVLMFNPDGSPMGMCGNGIRSVVTYIKKYLNKIETNSVINLLVDNKTFIKAQLINSQNNCDTVAVEMGVGSIKEKKTIHIADKTFAYTFLEVPNPHAVIFVDELPSIENVNFYGPKIENHSNFPNRTNVEFVKVNDNSSLDILIWERGVGFTLACGTGACAAALAAFCDSRINQIYQVNVPGGTLKVEISAQNDLHYLKLVGPSKEVFTGSFFIE